MKTSSSLALLGVVLCFAGIMTAQQPGQPNVPTVEVKPKAAVDPLAVEKIKTAIAQQQAASATYSNLKTKSDLDFEKQAAPLKAVFDANESKIKAFEADARKANGWGDEVTLDRNKLGDPSTSTLVFIKPAPKPELPPVRKTDPLSAEPKSQP